MSIKKQQPQKQTIFDILTHFKHTHTHSHRHTHSWNRLKDNASGFINDRNYSYYYYKLRSK